MVAISTEADVGLANGQRLRYFAPVQSQENGIGSDQDDGRHSRSWRNNIKDSPRTVRCRLGMPPDEHFSAL